jgi:hypothetical protein
MSCTGSLRVFDEVAPIAVIRATLSAIMPLQIYGADIDDDVRRIVLWQNLGEAFQTLILDSAAIFGVCAAYYGNA